MRPLKLSKPARAHPLGSTAIGELVDYAYSRGISSAREIARRCTYEPAFQWLCGLGEINHHTLSDLLETNSALWFPSGWGVMV
jgi:transposase